MRPVPAMRRSYALRRLLALVAVAAIAGGPIYGLERLAVRDDAKAKRGVPPAAPANPPSGPHVATPLLSVRRVPGLVAGADPSKTLREKLAAIPVADSSCLSVAVDGVTVHRAHESTPVTPASNMKLLVATAAVEVLAPTTRFRTSVVTATPVDDAGVVAGDLYMLGGGDPLLSTDVYRQARAEDPKHAADTYTSLEELADKVVAAGVKTVTGAIVGDDSRYDQTYTDPAWNTNDVASRPGAIGALRLDGGLSPKGVPLTDPATAAAATLGRLLIDRGVQIGGNARAGKTPAGSTELVAVESVEIGAVVGEMLRGSDNGTAEMLVKELGKAEKGEGSTNAGLAVISARLGGWNVPIEGIALIDGSGLSDQNRLTCQLLLAVIERTAPGQPIADGLPVAGTSGTLVDLLKNSPVTGQLRGKTGSLANVRALTGILATKGHVLQFAYVLNEPGIGAQPATAEPQWRRLADALVTFPFLPDLTPYQPAQIVA